MRPHYCHTFKNSISLGGGTVSQLKIYWGGVRLGQMLKIYWEVRLGQMLKIYWGGVRLGQMLKIYWGGVRLGQMLRWSRIELLYLCFFQPVFTWYFPSVDFVRFRQVGIFGEKNKREPWHNLFLERGKRMEIHKISSESDKYRESYTTHSSVSFVRWPGAWRQADVSSRQVGRDNYRPQDLFLFLFLFLCKSLLWKDPTPITTGAGVLSGGQSALIFLWHFLQLPDTTHMCKHVSCIICSLSGSGFRISIQLCSLQNYRTKLSKPPEYPSDIPQYVNSIPMTHFTRNGHVLTR